MKRFVCCVALLLFVVPDLHPATAGTITVGSKAEAAAVRRRIKAVRFLDSATFGARKADIDALVTRMSEIGNKKAMVEWIDQQFALDQTLLEPIAIRMIEDDGLDWEQGDAWVQRYRHQAFWHVAMTAPDQLRQRVAFALSQICVINDSMFGGRHIDLSGKVHYLAPVNYYDMLGRNASKSYRDVLMDVTTHPCMGQFLSHFRNRKADESINRFPDENYAREIMQLFSIGLYQLRPNGVYEKDDAGELIPTYDNEDIKNFARVFTGFTSDGLEGFWGWPHNSFVPMVMWGPEHDSAEKVLLNGTVLPAGQTGMEDVNGAIDNLMAHPNIGPFVGRRLIQRLTKSNPTRAYLTRVSKKFNNSGGDLKTVVKAILLDKTVLAAVKFKTTKQDDGTWTVEVLDNGTDDSKFQEPMIRYTSFLRKFGGQTENPNGWFHMAGLGWNWTQAFLGSPSVFNFYLPDFQPPGDIVSYKPSGKVPNRFLAAPEFELYTAVTANRTPNRYRWDIYQEKSQHNLFTNEEYEFTNNILLDFADEKALASDPVALVNHLDILLARGNLSNTMRQTLIDALTEETDDATDRAHAAILCVLYAPQTAITR